MGPVAGGIWLYDKIKGKKRKRNKTFSVTE